MASPKKKAKAKTVIKFRDLESKKSPKGGAFTSVKIEDPVDSTSTSDLKIT